MDNPLFSVIIPTYNRAGLIVKTIESVLNQTFKDFEIIVVDNKSTDNTVEVLQPYLQSGKIRLYVQDKNYERARSRNKGFDEAKGQIVTLLDSDDVIYPDCLADAVNYNKINPAVKFFHCSYEVVDEAGKVLSKGDLSETHNPFKRLANGNYISNIGVFIDRSVASSVRVDETPVLIGMEDYDFLLRILSESGAVGFIPKINCGVLHHPMRTVLSQDMEAIERRVEYLNEKALSHDLFEGRFAPYKKDFLSANHLYICGAAAIRKMPAKAFSHWIKAAQAKSSAVFSIKFWKHFLVIIKYMFK